MLRYGVYAIVGSALVFGGCEKKDPAGKTTTTVPSIDAAKKAAGDAGKSVQTALIEGRDKAVAAAETGAAELRAQMDTLRQKAAAASAEARPAIETAIKDLDAQMVEVDNRLKALRSASAETWQTLSADLQSTMTRARDNFKSAMDKYGK